MIKLLASGDIDNFSYAFQELVLNSLSFNDINDTELEKSYHLFVLGLLVILSDQYAVRSNRESGHGRYDLMLIPRDVTKTGIIIEFKKAPTVEQFTKTCQEVLNQIKQKNYIHELRAQGVKNIIIYGIAFFKKQLLVSLEVIQ